MAMSVKRTSVRSPDMVYSGTSAIGTVHDMLLDEIIPNFDHSHIESTVMPGSAEDIYPRARHGSFQKTWATQLLYQLRGIPDFPNSIDGMIDNGFVLIKEDAPHEFVMGLAGQFWKRSGGRVDIVAGDFASYAEPGHSIVVMNFHLAPRGPGRTRVSTESRVRSNGPQAKAAMGLYWSVIYPFSKFIRREMLRSIADHA